MTTYDAILWSSDRAKQSIITTLRAHFEGDDRFTYTDYELETIALDIVADLYTNLPNTVTV